MLRPALRESGCVCSEMIGFISWCVNSNQLPPMRSDPAHTHVVQDAADAAPEHPTDPDGDWD